MNLGPKAPNVVHRDESFLDQFAQISAGDMFGKDEESQKMKQVYEQTGRIITTEETRNVRIEQNPSQRIPVAETSGGYQVVTPIDYKKMASAVSEDKLCAALLNNSDYSPEKDKKITEVASECATEASEQLKKILKSLR